MVSDISGFKPSVAPPRSGFEHPLLDFEGVLKSQDYEAKAIEGSTRPLMIVKFNFTDVQVIDARSPYLFPIATIEVVYSEFDKNAWSTLSESIRKVLPGDADYSKAIDLLVGKRQHWVWSDTVLQGPAKDEDGNDLLNEKGKKTYVDQPGKAWKIMSVEGFGGAAGNLYDALVDLIDGKTDAAFGAALFDTKLGAPLKQLQGYRDAVNSHTEDKLLPMLEGQGKITRDAQGVWHKVESTEAVT